MADSPPTPGEAATIAARPAPMTSTQSSSNGRRGGISSVHFLAGGLGGMAGSIVTAPFDLVKTRLQSDTFRSLDRNAHRPHKARGLTRAVWHFVETGQIIRDISRREGPLALFRGLGPLLVGAVPARAINFWSYGNGKNVYADLFNDGREGPLVHLSAAATAGVITGTATNPIWVVKTRLQLQKRASPPAPLSSSAKGSAIRPPPAPRLAAAHLHTAAAARDPFATSLGCIQHIWRHEGLRGFYSGLTASYLGIAEGAIQWTLYEQFKAMAKRRRVDEGANGAGSLMGAAGVAKLVATTITYPHEVVRTRMRQAPIPGQAPKYTGLWQTFRVILAEEGLATFYNGLSPHIMRTVPNACVMYVCYEAVMRFANVPTSI